MNGISCKKKSAVFSTERRLDRIGESFNTRGVNCEKSVELNSQVKIGFDPPKIATFCFYAISSSTRSTE